MKLMRMAVVALTAMVLYSVYDASVHTAAAQLPRQEPVTQGRAPQAAPTGERAASAPLAAPSGSVDATLIDERNETAETFTPLGLFARADIVVKAVMVLLIICSFWSWVLIIDKWMAFSLLKRRARKFEQVFWSGRPLDELYAQYAAKTDQPMAAVFVAALREWKRAFDGPNPPRDAVLLGVKERVDKAMNVSIQREMEKLERGLGFLATVGSTAPFVGLFGTVWGIMNSFQAIAVRQDTTLAVVAPGIAEALFATALGLLAAIPAVVAYNRFVNEASRFSARLESFADEFSAYLSRQLDERRS